MKQNGAVRVLRWKIKWKKEPLELRENRGKNNASVNTASVHTSSVVACTCIKKKKTCRFLRPAFLSPVLLVLFKTLTVSTERTERPHQPQVFMCCFFFPIYKGSNFPVSVLKAIFPSATVKQNAQTITKDKNKNKTEITRKDCRLSLISYWFRTFFLVPGAKSSTGVTNFNSFLSFRVFTSRRRKA